MCRKSNSHPLPVRLEYNDSGGYEIYPAFETEDEIYIGWDSLSSKISSNKIVVIDGFEGVFWGEIISDVKKNLEKRNLKVSVKNIADCLKPKNEINNLIEPFMGEHDSIFGRMTTLRMIDFFDRAKLSNVCLDMDSDLTVVYGTGASLSGLHKLKDASLIYIEIPKNELQFRMAAGSVFNFGSDEVLDQREAYKRCYFIEWPILDHYRASILYDIDWMVDGQRLDECTYISGAALIKSLEEMSHNPFRVRPWFAPGVWGGSYLRDNIEGLNKEEINIAWSYELMALENGILFKHDGVLLEVSFSLLMFYAYKDILGDCAEDFKEDFPIRFDFLDTLNGGNLSIQCHPRPEYIRSNFGKEYTQDETYYILRCDEGALVYLGFQYNINKAQFSEALTWSQENAHEINITDYVQTYKSEKHKLFLIPNGTIHASGAGNLVLEISSAPYIFTFKMYDWVRLDIDGRPRPINIEHGLNNVRYERKGKSVEDTLISKPYVLEASSSYMKEHLPTHPEQFYDVHRYKVYKGGAVRIDDKEKCHVWMVVEGERAELQTSNSDFFSYNYLETFIVPASVGPYIIFNRTDGDIMLVKAFVKDDYTL